MQRRLPALIGAATTLLLSALSVVPVLAGPALSVGEVVVAGFQGSVYRVDPALGSVQLFAQAVHLDAPFNVAASANGRAVFVADQNSGGGSVIRIDLATGIQSTLVSGDSVYAVDAIALGPDGYLYAGRGAGPLGPAAIVRIDPQSGAVTAVSSGGNLSWPRDMEFSADATLYVLEALYVSGGAIGAVLRIDLGTGAQTIVASGGYFQAVQGLGTAANGFIYVVDSFAADRVLKIDAASGQQSIVSENGMMCLPRDVAVERDGNLLVTDGCAAVPCPSGTCVNAAVLRIDSQGGAQTVVASNDGLDDPSGLIIFQGGSVTASRATTWGAVKAAYR